MSKNKLPSNKNFGIVFFSVFLLLAIYFFVNEEQLSKWALLTSLIFLVLGLINSKILSPLNILWFKFGILLGKMISPLIMGIIFFLVVTPTGLIMRVLRRDILNLKYSKNKSYWIEKKDLKSQMKNQY